jgi:putative transposase
VPSRNRTPPRADSLARALGRNHSCYARRFNLRYHRSGHLCQNHFYSYRFYSCPLGGSHLPRALAYVDLNPVRAGLVGRAADYPWSSARAHVAGVGQDPCVHL